MRQIVHEDKDLNENQTQNISDETSFNDIEVKTDSEPDDERVSMIRDTLLSIEKTRRGDFKLLIYGLILGSLISGINVESIKNILQIISRIF